MLYLNDGATPRRTIDPSQRHLPGAVWIDLVDPTEDERAAAERLTGLRVPSRDEIAEIESSSRIYTEGGTLYLSMPYSSLGADGRPQLSPVGFVLSDTHLLTLRFATLAAFDVFAERHEHDGGPGGGPGGVRGGVPGSAETFIGLTETIVGRQADALERIAAELDRLSKATFSDAVNRGNLRRADRDLRALLMRVGLCGDKLGNLRDSVVGLGRIVAYAQPACENWTPPELKARLATLREDLASLNDYDQQLSNKVGFLLDAVLGFINIEQNNGVKVLTIASVVGIPPTFVVGLYGMNFKNMPEYDWHYGYQFGWAMILASVIVPLVWFRVKGWI